MTGPIKGALALANYLIREREVYLVIVKNIKAYEPKIDKRIKVINLDDYCSSFIDKIFFYKKLLRNAGPKENLISVSMLLSSDFINIFCSKYALICSSIRGNLPQAYKMDYGGYLGYFVGIFHLISLRKFDKLIVMSLEMKKQVDYFSGKDSKIIGNFIDEDLLERYRTKRELIKNEDTRFVYVGRISRGKNPILLINTISKLHKNGFKVYLDIIGDGPLLSLLSKKVRELNLIDFVKIHGHQNNPFSLISSSDVFILPSYTEGTSRACLEALFLGLPCIVRKVDGNSELIEDGINGFLFEDDNDLYNIMVKAIKIDFKRHINSILIPDFYRQSTSARTFLRYIEEV